MIKEVATGITLGVVVGLIWAGYNIYPVLLLIGLFFFLYKMIDLRGGVKQFVPNKISSEKAGTNISFEDVGGQATAKRELLESLDFIKKPQIIQKLGIRPIKGILLSGPPGTGKTLLAKAAASYTDSEFISAAGSEFVEMYAGVGAQRVRQLFNQAKTTARKNGKNSAIVFIDEIDILGGKRGNSNTSHKEMEQTVNQLLVEMDGLGVNEQVHILLIGATNRADLLDDALLRPGRFDRIVQVDLPDLEGRLQILTLHAKNKPLDPSVDLRETASETFGFSGAHLENLTNEAAISALREKSSNLTKKHFSEAIDKVILGEKIERSPGKEEYRRIALHETGHALVSECIRPHSISTITIIPRGKAMGYIRQLPEKDTYIHTREHIDGQIAILLGGAITEEEILGNRSTGAADDFQQAVNLAKRIIDSGMSSLGIVSIKDLPGNILHESIKEIMNEQESRVRELVLKYKETILDVSEYLLQKERISGQYLRDMLKEKV